MARFLGVTLPTVVNWVNAGRLEAHRTAGGHRRIARSDLIAFGRASGMPLPAEVLDPDPTRRKRVLLIDDESDYADVLRDFLRMQGEIDVELAGNAFAAGLSFGRFRPDLVVVSMTMRDLDAHAMLEALRSDEDLRSISVIACAPPEPGTADTLSGFDGFLEKPVGLDILWREVQDRLGLAA